jgi:cytochrome c oxidase subunit 4
MANRGGVALREHEKVEHHSHVGRYVVVWAALLVLTVLTWWLSRFHVPGGWGVAIALGIACAKGALVALFFMHLWDQEGANRLVFLTSIVFVALLIGLTLSDNATRFQLSNPPGSEGALPRGPIDYDATPPAAPPRPHGPQGATGR